MSYQMWINVVGYTYGGEKEAFLRWLEPVEIFIAEDIELQAFFFSHRYCILTAHLYPSTHQRNHSSKSQPRSRCLLLFLCMFFFLLNGNLRRLQNQKDWLTFSISLNGRHVEVEITLIVSSQTKLYNLFCLYCQNRCSSEYINLSVQYNSRLAREVFL